MKDEQAILILYHMKYILEHPEKLRSKLEEGYDLEKSTALSLAVVALEKKIERENMNYR